MISYTEIVNRYGKRQILITAVVLLFVLNALKFGYSFYQGQLADLEQQGELLEKYQSSTAKIDELRKRVVFLEQQKKQMEGYLFAGESEEEIASAMQIMLQDMVVKAGLDPESLRASGVGDSSRDKEFGEISVKARLAGTLQGFAEFVANLYKGKRLFRIESFTLKPYKKTELKIFMDLKGFYKVKQEKSKPKKEKTV